MKSTVVTAFFPDTNSNRSTETYVQLGQQLMNIPVKKILFTTSSIAAQLKINNETTRVYLLDLRTELPSFEIKAPEERNVNKDTIEYLWLINHKASFINFAARCNPFQMEQFVWLDFGILHVCNPSTFEADVIELCSKPIKKDVIRIASIWDVKNKKDGDVNTKSVEWYFAGGVFGGNRKAIQDFCKWNGRVLIDLISKKQKITWEVNIWASIYYLQPDLFDPFPCDHNTSIVTHF